MNYTPEQLNIINHTNGNLKIVACAGSGKTEVISRRVANLLKAGVKANSIVCFTFTEKAAKEVKILIKTYRFYKRISGHDYYLSFHTRILKRDIYLLWHSKNNNYSK